MSVIPSTDEIKEMIGLPTERSKQEKELKSKKDKIAADRIAHAEFDNSVKISYIKILEKTIEDRDKRIEELETLIEEREESKESEHEGDNKPQSTTLGQRNLCTNCEETFRENAIKRDKSFEKLDSSYSNEIPKFCIHCGDSVNPVKEANTS